MNVLLFLLIAVFWSGSFLAIQPLVQAMPPLLAGALRLAVGLVFLAGLFPFLGVTFRLASELRRRVWLTGFAAFGVPFALLFWGERSISPGLAGILNGTVPIWVFLLGLAFTPKAEPISARKVLGLFSGIAGICAIFLPKVFATDGEASILGMLAVALMAVSYAVSVLMNRTLFLRHPGLSPFTNLFHQLLAGFLSLFLIAVIFEGWPHPSQWSPLSTVVLAELYLGCVSTSVAFLMFYRLIQRWGSVRAATVTYVIPAVTVTLDFVLNSRVPQPSEFFGVLGITAGVLILNLPTRAR